MELSHDEVRKIAELAKLELSPEEVELYAGQLSSILQYFRRLQELDTSAIAPTASVLPLSNVMREDVVETPLTPEEAVQNAFSSVGPQFLVSNVLDES